jgi:hypothetical protein
LRLILAGNGRPPSAPGTDILGMVKVPPFPRLAQREPIFVQSLVSAYRTSTGRQFIGSCSAPDALSIRGWLEGESGGKLAGVE